MLAQWCLGFTSIRHSKCPFIQLPQILDFISDNMASQLWCKTSQL
jgi:hypothetical protein